MRIDSSVQTYFEEQLASAISGLLEAEQRFSGAGDEVWIRFFDYIGNFVPAYRGIRWRGSRLATVQSLPPLGREEVRAAALRFRSTQPAFDLIRKTSSGSISESIEVEFDRCAQFALNKALWESVVRRIPPLSLELAPGHVGIVIVRDDPRHVEPSVIIPAVGYPVCRWLCVPLCPSERYTELAELCAANPPILYGLPRCLRRLMDALRQLGLRLTPRCIVCGGERLYVDDSFWLRDFFNAPIINAYACSEGGLVALSSDDEQSLFVDRRFCLVEVLSDDGKIQMSGSGELLITTIFNWHNPLLRIKVGDWGQLETMSDGSQILRSVRRMSELSNIGAAGISTELVDGIFSIFGINEARLRVRGDSGMLIVGGSINQSHREPDLKRALTKLLGVKKILIRQTTRVVGSGGKRLRYPA